MLLRNSSASVSTSSTALSLLLTFSIPEFFLAAVDENAEALITAYSGLLFLSGSGQKPTTLEILFQ